MSSVKVRPASLDRISVIVPVKNEEASIAQLLRGVLGQTHRPAEIVITDGGSDDRTKEIIREHQASCPIPIVLIETDHALPGRGRNLAIARATHEWIASIDGGIHPRPDWLEHLVATARREPRAEIIYGAAEPLTDTYFTECAAISYVPGGRLTQFIASCLLRRSAWAAAGGFREDLRSGEDLLFFRSLKAAGVKAANCDDALVVWELRPTLARTFRRFSLYSRHNMRAGLGREWQFNVTRLYLIILVLLVGGFFVRPLLLLPPAILLLRAGKRIWGYYRVRAPERLWPELLNPRRALTVAWISVVIDTATLYGLWQWLLHDRARPVNELRPSGNSPLD
ncbi:MAG: glycosyltransferase [Acidobacteria bacterium]|nr:glycosyltransferase [Acidobacteriota bacterium]